MTELSTVPELALLKAEAELKNRFQAGFWQPLYLVFVAARGTCLTDLPLEGM